MNRVSLTGRLTRDPELRETKEGKPVCNLRLAVDGPRGGKPTYVSVSAFGGQAEAAAASLRKGQQVAISGRLVLREWEGRDGRRRSEHSVWGAVEFLGRRRKRSAEAASEEGTLFAPRRG